MRELSLRDYLEQKNKDDLIAKMRVAGLKYTGLMKDTIIDILEEYLSHKDTIQDIWDRLSPFEREYLGEYFKYNTRPSYHVLNELNKKYDREMQLSRKPWGEQSLMNLLFFDDMIPSLLRDQLQKNLPSLVIDYDTIDEPPLDENSILNTIGEDFFRDFEQVLNLAKVGKLEVTKKKKDPTKRTIIKINDLLLHKELLLKEIERYGRGKGIENITKFEDTNRIYGIYMILLESGLLYVKGTKGHVSSKVETFLKERIEDRCKYLLQGYMNSKSIFEVSRIKESDYEVESEGNMMPCRQFIINALKKCPVGTWIKASQFVDYLRQINSNFLMNQVGYIVYFSEKHRVYLEPWVEWEDVEGRFIEVVLQEYLSVLGIVDTIIHESLGGCWDYDELSFFRVEYFRITPLGAYVLGIQTDYQYEEEVQVPGFTVEEDNIVKIENTIENQIHQLFFSEFARKKKSSQYSLYPLTFNAIAKAIEKGFTVKEILDYIDENSLNPMSQDMKDTILKWEEYLNKTTIENIKIVRTESREIYEAIQNDPSFKKYILDDLAYAVQIHPDSAGKVKQRIKKITEKQV